MRTELKRAHREAGLCHDCNQPTDGSTQWCARHRETHALANQRYRQTENGAFTDSTYERSMRRYGLRLISRERVDLDRLNGIYRLLGVDGQPVELEPITPQSMDAVNERRRVLLNIERCGGWDLHRVRLDSGL